ncbi:uncharacterized protein LOC130686491 [Daphnia carinata]|uniref:uncharacterized protein LOC130686491 n=1 Tax=Daphnia carinata TaxID=120202 RepID=UPI0025801024|nr:uncharacterized protein LOC130686491 [Daphnia carinata]
MSFNSSMATHCLLIKLFLFTLFVHSGFSIKCHQCSSSQDPKGQDNCGAYKLFDTRKSIPVDCNSDESVTPGTFCVKITQQGPRSFVWDGRWRQVIRRCASVADTGVTGVCNWGVKENGVYWEECYCAQDGCNGGSQISTALSSLLVPIIISIFTKQYAW